MIRKNMYKYPDYVILESDYTSHSVSTPSPTHLATPLRLSHTLTTIFLNIVALSGDTRCAGV
ncbi:hypothetical protein HanRHA438_Chr16g0768331 [Helianthus annuus]|nr:hypothetical protein HanRHA438_Chr16g0768331 [Helianthus annuus]